MPKKTRSHDLEDESSQAFKALLPPFLLYREKAKDYGIDGEVEEFDENGVTTGLVFLVQLKGTDEQDSKKALAYSLPRGHVAYYRNLTLPVLMVRYVAPTNTVYTRWSHSLDTYGKKADWKTATFRWDDEDAWSDSRPSELVAEARAFLDLRSSRMTFPVELHRDLQPPELWGLGPDEIEIALRRQIVPRVDLLRLGVGEKISGTARLIVQADRLAVEFARVTAVTAHLEQTFVPESADQLARDLFSLCALAFERFGQLRAAGLLAMTYLPESILLNNEEGVLALHSAMAESRQITEALALAEALDQGGDEDRSALSLLFLLVALHHSATLSDFERHTYRDVARRRIERRGDSTEAAQEAMNLAQFELVSGDPDNAVQLHEKVLELDPSYAKRAHYRREKAGALFLSAEKVETVPRGAPGDAGPPNEMWAKVVKAYEDLTQLADEPRDQALLADALMFAGHYQAALDLLMVFNQENEDPDPRDHEWILKEMVLSEIVNECGITQQDRRAVVLEPAPTEAGELDELLRQDALTPMVWWNLGIDRFEAGDMSDAALPFLAAGLITGWDANAWAHAFLGFFVQERIDLLPLLLSTGERMSRGHMVVALTELVKAQDEQFPRQHFLAALRQQLDELPSVARDGTEVRLLRGDGSVESIMLPGATASAEDPSPDAVAEIPEVGRNEPCPCGSGRKYKKCHGAG